MVERIEIAGIDTFSIDEKVPKKSRLIFYFLKSIKRHAPRCPYVFVRQKPFWTASNDSGIPFRISCELKK